MSDLEGLAREREPAEEPHEALGSGALLLALLVHNKQFERGGLGGVGIVTSTDFLEAVV